MKASEFYYQGQALRETVGKMFPNMFEKPESKEAPEQPQQTPAGQQPQADRSSPQYNQGTPVRQPQSPNRGSADMGRFDPKYAGESEFNLSREFAYDERIVDKIVQKYVAAGYDPRYAIGKAANGIVESNLIPTAFNAKEGAFGMFQWRNDRLDGLKDFADRIGKTINDTDTNIDFSIEELRTTQQGYYNKIIKADPQTAADYARLIDKHYERSDGKARERRAAIAAQLWRDYYGEGGRAEGPMLSFSEDTVPITQPNAQTRDEYVAQMAQSNPAGGLDMGSLLEAREAAQPEDTPMENPAVDYMVGQSMEQQAPPQAAPTTAELSGEVSRSSQSPTGGQSELGNSRDAAGTGTMRDGIMGGLQDIFGRREEESDASFGDRRRNIFLNAAEGFQMLSRGVKADFVTPTQQRLNQAQRRVDNQFRDTEQVRQQGNFDSNMALQQRQESRLQQRLQLDQATYAMSQAAKMADMQKDQTMQSGMVDFFATQGYQDLAALAQNGASEQAFKIYQEREEGMGADVSGPDAFTLSDGGAMAAASRAREMGRDDIATVIEDRKQNPRAAYEAYKESLGLQAEMTAEGQFNDELYDSMVRAIPASLPPSKQDMLKADAETAAQSGSDTVVGKWFDARDDAVESGSSTTRSMNSYLEAEDKRFQEKMAPAAELAQAARTGMNFAANPNFTPNALKGNVLTPIARFLEGMPGGSALADELLGVSPEDLTAGKMLEGLKNTQLGNLSKGVAGQLSNLEGQKLLSAFGDDTMTQVEILALGQMMIRNRDAEVARQDARYEYQRQVEAGERQFTPGDLAEYMNAAGRKVKMFNRVSSEEERAELIEKRLAGYAADEGITLEQALDMDPLQYPAELRGEVVSQLTRDSNGNVTGVEFVPLFKEALEPRQ